MKLLEHMKMDRIGATVSVHFAPRQTQDGGIAFQLFRGKLVHAGEDGIILKMPNGNTLYVRPEMISGPVIDEGFLDQPPMGLVVQ